MSHIPESVSGDPNAGHPAPATDEGTSAISLLDLVADLWRSFNASQVGTDTGLTAFQRELALKQFSLDERRVAEDERRGLLEERRVVTEEGAQEFLEEDTITRRLQEAAALATGPAGALQLAFMARGQGAPQEQIRELFQSLPFLQSLLAGEALPQFGLPEQLGGAGRTQGIKGNTITGQTFGITLPGKTAVTEQQFTGLSAFEQDFLGALGQTGTGQSSEGFLSDIMASFLPTTKGFGAFSF